MCFWTEDKVRLRPVHIQDWFLLQPWDKSEFLIIMNLCSQGHNSSFFPFFCIFIFFCFDIKTLLIAKKDNLTSAAPDLRVTSFEIVLWLWMVCWSYKLLTCSQPNTGYILRPPMTLSEPLLKLNSMKIKALKRQMNVGCTELLIFCEPQYFVILNWKKKNKKKQNKMFPLVKY